jgi:hypothetical protein
VGDNSNFQKRWFELYLALQEPENLYAASKINAAICLKPVCIAKANNSESNRASESLNTCH